MKETQRGMALVMVLILGAIGFIVLTLGLTVASINLQSTQISSLGTEALQIAESGAENALIRLLRDPNYTGETLTIGDGTATITVTGTNPQVITTVGSLADVERTIQVEVTEENGITAVQSWTEVP